MNFLLNQKAHGYAESGKTDLFCCAEEVGDKNEDCYRKRL